MWLHRSNSDSNRNSFSIGLLCITLVVCRSSATAHSVVIGTLKHCCCDLCTSVKLFYIWAQFDSLSVVLVCCRHGKWSVSFLRRFQFCDGFSFATVSALRRDAVEVCFLLGYYAAYSGNFVTTFRYNLSAPASWPLKMRPLGYPETSVRNDWLYVAWYRREVHISVCEMFGKQDAVSSRKWKVTGG
jgi:hypothetical protein